MMKRFHGILAALLAVTFLLTGCGTGGTASSAPASGFASSAKSAYASASAEDVQTALSDGSAIVVDARTESSYSGWVCGGNQLGGHIDGATDFSANWLTCSYDDTKNDENMTRDDLLKQYMSDRQISKDSAVIVYDENGTDAAAVADYFASQGVSSIKLFNLSDWTQPLEKYTNYQLYVPVDVFHDLLDGKSVSEIPGSGPVVLEVSWGPEKESGFQDGHIPGAIHVNSDDFDDENHTYVLESDDVLVKLALSQGITSASTVIVTGDPIFSCRYATILRYLGVENVFVLSGGANAWTDAGYELVTDEPTVTPATEFGCNTPANPDVIDTVSETQEMLKESNYTLVDNRTKEEYEGKTSGYSYFDKAGRIEGAVYGYAGINTSGSMLYYRNIDGTMRNTDQILAMWKTCGIDTANHLAFMCGGGYRAAEVYWDSLVMGLTNTSLFADGWCGWAQDGLPTVTG